MGFPRGSKVIFDPEMHLRGSGGKPCAAAYREMRRFGELHEAEDVRVKRSRIGFPAARHCQLHVMNRRNHELIMLAVCKMCDWCHHEVQTIGW